MALAQDADAAEGEAEDLADGEDDGTVTSEEDEPAADAPTDITETEKVKEKVFSKFLYIYCNVSKTVRKFITEIAEIDMFGGKYPGRFLNVLLIVSDSPINLYHCPAR